MNLLKWIFGPPKAVNCFRCGSNLRTETGLLSPCPTCGLEYFATASLDLFVRVGDWTAHDLAEAEQLAKEQGIELPPWPKTEQR